LAYLAHGSVSATMSDDNLRSFARRKFELIEAAGSDPELSASHFRLLLCVLDRLPEGSNVTQVGDDYLRVECPGYRRDGSLRVARKEISSAGYWTFSPGRGREATTYTIRWDRVPRLLAERKERAKLRKARRDDRDEAFRALAKVRRGELVPSPGKIDPPSQAEQGVSKTPSLDRDKQGGIKSASPQTAQLGPGENDPPFNSSTSIVEANREEVPSYARTRERLLHVYAFDGDELDLAASMMGGGNRGRGFVLLSQLEDEHLRALAGRLDQAGAELSADEIRAARDAAIRLEMQAAWRAAR
jgi:hypothetical protein